MKSNTFLIVIALSLSAVAYDAHAYRYYEGNIRASSTTAAEARQKNIAEFAMRNRTGRTILVVAFDHNGEERASTSIRAGETATLFALRPVAAARPRPSSRRSSARKLSMPTCRACARPPRSRRSRLRGGR